ncbi:MAG: hypothetical protein ABIG67_00220 [Pseudomonadota bacterium]
MKIKLESQKIIKAVKKLEGIEILVENVDDAKEAIKLILNKTGFTGSEGFSKLKDIKVTSFQKYETSAVDYKIIFLLEFLFDEDTSMDKKIAMIKELQEFFDKV